jgi:(E)-4-hydroxy-3-methylbut-2-enyl-diphosphate synthase
MVESALEFLRIAEEENFYSIVLSMKSSNPQVMVQAYRLLVKKMQEENMYYPLHLGVTEAGDGEDGRIKSAVGIGTLLEDGLGDTIRVSLTEEPEFEIPVAKALAERYSKRRFSETSNAVLSEKEKLQLFSSGYSPYDYSRNPTLENLLAGGGQVPKVVGDLSNRNSILPQNLFALGYQYNPSIDKWNIGDMACDFLFAGNAEITFELPGTLSVIQHYPVWCRQKEKERHFPLIDFKDYELLADHEKDSLFFVHIQQKDLDAIISAKYLFNKQVIWLISNEGMQTAQQMRTMLFKMRYAEISQPILIHVDYRGISKENLQLYAAADLGCLLTEGFGDGIWIHADEVIGNDFINRLAFGILQATRTRISKTEYISCPSCGRTLFDLQETTARIRKETDHLKGLKIGIMGCIVNGPGEMADADYGYVGSGPGKITLYKGKEVVLKSIDTPLAVDALIELIRKNGDWVDKPE